MSAQVLRGPSRKRSIPLLHRKLSSSFLGSFTYAQNTTYTAPISTFTRGLQSLTSYRQHPFLFRSFASQPDAEKDEKTQSNSDAESFQFRNTPLAKLNLHYLQEHEIPSVTNNIHASSLNMGGFVLWTAVFVCPVTGESSPAGTLRSSKDKIEPVSESPEVYYKTKKLAIHAAAARALDAIQFKQSGKCEPRLCEEDPESDEIIRRDQVHRFSSVALEDTPYNDERRTIESVSDESELVALEEDEIFNDLDNVVDGVVPDDEQADEEHYIVTNMNTSKRQSPYKSLLEALTASPASSQLGVDKASLYLPTGYSFLPYVRLNAARKTAYGWVEAMNEKGRVSHGEVGNPHVTLLPSNKEEDTERTLQTGKAILYQLAQAYQGVTLSRRKRGVQQTAEAVLNVLWRTTGLQPDADAYAYYLKCIEGNGVASVAKAAENIVLAMESGARDDQGRILPKPNTLVINSLIQVWAQQGGKAGRYMRTFEGFTPDRESFLSLLSSSSYLDNEELDFDFLHKCIQRMEELDDKNSGQQSLLPGQSEYNAPLRWSGGSLTQLVRPYGRYVRFDRYDRLIPSTKEDQCTALERWVREAESKNMATIETYEALIQAHLRTRSYAGLLKALDVAEKLLKDPNRFGARLLTFQPIVAAWLQSGHDEAPAVLLNLVQDLTRASKVDIDLMPDGRMIDALLAVYVQKQSKLLSEKRNKLNAEDVRPIADACFEQLDELCNQLEQSVLPASDRKVFIETSSFVHCLQSWRNVIEVINDDDPSDLLAICIQRVWDTFLLYEKILQVAGSAGNKIHFLQLEYLLAQGHHVNSLIVEILQLLRRQRRDHTGVFDDGQIMFCIERITRRSCEYEELLRSRSSNEQPENDEITLFYGDHFFYWGTHPLASARNEDTNMREKLSLLRDCWVDGADRGPVLRITYLLKDLAISQNVSAQLLHLIDSLITDVLDDRRQQTVGDLYNKSGVKETESALKSRRILKEGSRRGMKLKRQRLVRRRLPRKVIHSINNDKG